MGRGCHGYWSAFWRYSQICCWYREAGGYSDGEAVNVTIAMLPLHHLLCAYWIVCSEISLPCKTNIIKNGFGRWNKQSWKVPFVIINHFIHGKCKASWPGRWSCTSWTQHGSGGEGERTSGSHECTWCSEVSSAPHQQQRWCGWSGWNGHEHGEFQPSPGSTAWQHRGEKCHGTPCTCCECRNESCISARFRSSWPPLRSRGSTNISQSLFKRPTSLTARISPVPFFIFSSLCMKYQ